jgi:hypothetical protein
MKPLLGDELVPEPERLPDCVLKARECEINSRTF